MKRSFSCLLALLSLASILFVDTAQAESDLSGVWAAQNFQDYQIRFPGPNFADYAGIPINKEARASALSYSSDTLTQLHHQCASYPITYLLLGPFGLRLSETIDPTSGSTVAWNMSGWVDRAPITIWMDGRPQPGSQALDTPTGFTTGKWHGNTLVTRTTHIADGKLTRNGVPNSNQESVTMYISRHADLLTITGIIQDPVNLSAPYILSRTWKAAPTLQDDYGIPRRAMYCMPEQEDPQLSDGRHVPNVLPGANQLVGLMLKSYQIPLDAIMGGAKTMYPEYQKTLRQSGYTPPAACTSNCCGWQNEGSRSTYRTVALLHCKGQQ